ncbi:MAG: flotillin family protein [Candidatus Tectimicrobiota bacterium]
MATGLIITAIAATVTVLLLLIAVRLYVRAPANMAFIRTGFGGKRVVIDGGALVLPVLQEIQWVSLETVKLEVVKANREGFITQDRYRVDVGAEFYLKVDPTVAAIERASRALGQKSLSPQSIKVLVEEKLVSALRALAARYALVELHENRKAYADDVKGVLVESLAHLGLTLEDVSIFSLDQTDKNQLDPNNIFDAEGLKQITAETSQRIREKNEIERNTEVAVKQKDVEAHKLKIALDQDQEFASADQMRQVETDRIEKRSATETFRFEQEQAVRQAEIARDQKVREFEIGREIGIIEREKAREETLIAKNRELQVSEIERELAVQSAQRERDIGILAKDKAKAEAQRERLLVEALREQAGQDLITVEEKAKADREKELALIAALKELEVTEQGARAVERLATSRRAEGEAEAYAHAQIVEAENLLTEKVIMKELVLRIIDQAPSISRELMEPARHIDSIKILDMGGQAIAAPGDGPTARPMGSLMAGIVNTGLALPFLREVLDFSKEDTQTLMAKILEQVPQLKEIVGCLMPPSPAAVPADEPIPGKEEEGEEEETS